MKNVILILIAVLGLFACGHKESVTIVADNVTIVANKIENSILIRQNVDILWDDKWVYECGTFNTTEDIE